MVGNCGGGESVGAHRGILNRSVQAAKKAFKGGMAQMQVDLAVAAQKCGKKAIEKARPYHDALVQARSSPLSTAHCRLHPPVF